MRIVFLVPIMLISIVSNVSIADHGGGTVSIDERMMEENQTSTNEIDIELAVIVTNNDPEDAWAIKFRGLLKDPVTGEYQRDESGNGIIITTRMTNTGGSSLYNLYPNETKQLNLSMETRNIPVGNWSVDIGVEIYELDTYTDVTTSAVFQIVNPPPEEIQETEEAEDSFELGQESTENTPGFGFVGAGFAMAFASAIKTKRARFT